MQEYEDNEKAFKAFYKTKAWQHCRDSYLKKVGGLCEICEAKGIITPAVIVHHKIHLNNQTIKDPRITLNFKNLQAVCRKCHGELHSNREHRYSVDAFGHVTIEK